MGLVGRPLLVLLEAAALLLGGCSGTFSHSLSYFYTGSSKSSQGLPRFTAVGYVDGQLFIKYDSDTQRAQPQVSWIEKLAEEDPQYWDRETRSFQADEPVFSANLETARIRYNQSRGGFHTVQRMYGCELTKDGRRRGYRQEAYDGRDFLSLDLETLTWTAADAKAEMTKRKWERKMNHFQYEKAYLEGSCIDCLQMYLDYGNETLRRTVPPTVRMERKAEDDGLETFVFRFHGFYPKEMDINWMRDGEVWTQDTFRGRVAPNSDGTYYTWHSIKIHPKERDHYRCHVEHDSLQEPLDLPIEESEGSVSVAVTVGSILGVLAVGLILGIVIYKKRQEKLAYNPALTSDQGRRAPPKPLTSIERTTQSTEDML